MVFYSYSDFDNKLNFLKIKTKVKDSAKAKEKPTNKLVELKLVLLRGPDKFPTS